MSASLPLIPRLATQDRTSRGVSNVPFPEVEYLRRPISSTNIAISAHLSFGRLNALGRESPFDHDHRLRNIGSGALLFPCGERIEIDELRIVWMGIAVELSAAMDVHQGLHTPGI